MPGVLGNRRGLVLVLVLSMVALLTVMVVEFSSQRGLDIELAYNFRDSLQAQYLARAGVEAAMALIADDDPRYDAEDEDWASFAEYLLAASVYLEGPSFSGTITDESSRIDLNALVSSAGVADEFRVAQLRRLFTLLEIDIGPEELDDLLNALVDWLDPDSETTFGAERGYYAALEEPYACKDGPMDSPEEILLVAGMEPEYYYGTQDYEGIRDYVTTGTGGKINLNTASETVLLSLSDNITPDMVAAFQECIPLKGPEEVLACIETAGFNAVPAEELTRIKEMITIVSPRFAVEVKGLMPTGAVVNIRALLDRTDKRPSIVYYRIY